ncbi:hypothetical protein ACLOJK_016033 [Asimina triloba]
MAKRLLSLRPPPSIAKRCCCFCSLALLHTWTPSSSHNRNPNRTPPPLKNPLLSLLYKSNGTTHLNQIHAQMILTGLLISDAFAASQLIAFCANSDSECGPDYGCAILLHSVPNPNTFMWNVVIRGFSERDDPTRALFLYKRMLWMGSRPDNYTLPLLLKASARLSAAGTGAGVLAHASRLGLDSDVFVCNAAIHLFAVCGGLDDARRVFDGSSARDLVSWNSMINGYVRSGPAGEALKLFREMEREGIEPDEVTMIGVVSSCAQLVDLELGRCFHRYMLEREMKFTVALTNALMDMYVKCGCLDQARQVFDNMQTRTVVSWTTMVAGHVKLGFLGKAREYFDKMPERDGVVWNAMISGYVQSKQGKEALALFREMVAAGAKPCEFTMVSLLSACAQMGALDMGIWVHWYINKRSIPQSIELATALVDMYAKCGRIEKSLLVFSKIPNKNALTWTAMIGGLAIHGHGQDAICYFLKMLDAGLKPDEVTFVEVLSACCHAGLVEEGREFFKLMSTRYGLSPKLKHYSCMLNLLGRAGLLDEAEDLIKAMPMEPDAVVWGALFFACRMHGNVAMGKRAALKLFGLDPYDSGSYVSLASMYMEANMQHEAGKVWASMRERGLEKNPGCSMIEVNGIVYEFVARDKSHPESKDIYACLMLLARQLELAGYMLGDSQIT